MRTHASSIEPASHRASSSVGAHTTDAPTIACGRGKRADGRNAARYASSAGPGGVGLKWLAKP